MKITNSALKLIISIVLGTGHTTFALDRSVDRPQISPTSPVYNYVQKLNDETKESLNHNTQDIFKVSIIGLELVIDSADPLWSSMSQGNISEIYLEADKIILKNKNNWPSANLTIVARELSIAPEGRLDLTPLQKIPPPTDHIGVNGEDGLPGRALNIYAEKISFHEYPLRPAFIVNGGPGQVPGKGEIGGAGKSVEPFPEIALRAFSPAEIEKYRGHLLGIEALQYKKTKICSGNMPGGRKWKTNCGKNEIN